jgi:excisionase family DNA binding protein
MPAPTEPSPAPTEPSRLALSPAEFAAAVGCSRQHVANMIARGELRSVKLGGRRLIPVAALDELLNGGDRA